MVASWRKLRSSVLALAVVLGCTSVSAGPAIRRQADDALSPWVSVGPNGQPVTFTPAVSTINGVATTLDLQPAAATIVSTGPNGSPVTTTAAAPTPTNTDGSGGAFPLCHNKDGINKPFCLPADGATLYSGQTDYVTWDTSFLPGNVTVNIIGNYANASIGGPQAFEFGPVANTRGYYSLAINGDWKQSMSSNNITLYLTSSAGANLKGPTITVTDKPVEYNRPSQPTPPSGQALYIALPTVLGFVLLCVIGGFIWNRKTRTIGLGNIMGRRKGYSSGKSRRQRMGLGKKSGAIKLRDQELTSEGQYRDAPVEQEASLPQHRRNDSEGLASLVATPTEERHQGENHFRDEIRRQENQRL